MFKKWEEIIIEWENCNPEVFKKLGGILFNT